MKSRRYRRWREDRILSPDEYKRRRRGRRMDRSLALEDQARAWAERYGCSLRVLNDRHHWLFQKRGFMAEWWPSSAKLAINRDYLRSHHAPHWGEVVAALELVLRRQAGLPVVPPLPDSPRTC